MRYLRTTAVYLATLLAACSSTPASQTNDGPGPGPDGGAAETASDTGEPLTACVDDPPGQPGPRSMVTVAVDLTYAGKPVVFGEPLDLPNGGTLTVGNFRFYVSDFQLRPAGDERVNVDIVAPDGKPAPYNVHLVNAEKPSEMTFRIAVPAGDYTAMSFLFGLNDACGRRGPGQSKPPLTFESQMTWPFPFTFLFLRYEGMLVGVTGQDGPLGALAMGGYQGLITGERVTADGALHVTSNVETTVRLRVALDEIFKAALLPIDPNAVTFPILPPASNVPGAPPGRSEILLGEHLRQNATKVPIFSVTSGS